MRHCIIRVFTQQEIVVNRMEKFSEFDFNSTLFLVARELENHKQYEQDLQALANLKYDTSYINPPAYIY